MNKITNKKTGQPEFTNEQLDYITHNDKTDTKLVACAGSGKTRCIIFKIENIIKQKQFTTDEILMLTFSRLTRDDFLNKIKLLKMKNIPDFCVKTIDSFAKQIIDMDNEIDVSLLSYKFMKYLENSTILQIKENKNLAKIKIIFIDEAQDLNEIQYKILIYMKEKNGCLLHLVGDPNQNIYQFRKSSDKYLTNFQAKTFCLTKNFRSFDSIINFSKYLRPVQTTDITGNKGLGQNCLPFICFHENDTDFRIKLIQLLKNAVDFGLDYSEIAILSPTRGRMKGFGGSNGLCLVTNVLYENGIKFEQFYEEATDEVTNNIKYVPKKGHVNVLTYMGAKGLEWKCVFLIDADVCLINKRHFNEEKHKNDQYLLYVACSRPIENLIIFSKFKRTDTTTAHQLNPWFSLVPKKYYSFDTTYKIPVKYPVIKSVDMGQNEKRITKLLDKLSEENLDKLCDICHYSACSMNMQNNQNEKIKKVTKIYDKDFSKTINSNIFLGKYTENLFCIHYCLSHGMPRKKFVDIENIIDSQHIITDVASYVSDWYYTNRDHYDWSTYNTIKHTLDDGIRNAIEVKFDKNHDFSKHTIVNDGYFKSFILSLKNSMSRNYNKYLNTNNLKMMRHYLFYIIVITYALETQHYFHVKNKGKKFVGILTLCSELFTSIEQFASETSINFTNMNVCISNEKTIGEIDALELDILNNKINIWEFKCTSEITLKHILQVLMYNIVYRGLETLEVPYTVNINFINFLKGEMIKINIELDKTKINDILQLMYY